MKFLIYKVMKYLVKFNEQNILSNDRITEILKELEISSSEIDKFKDKYETIVKELDSYTSKDKNANTQIDDAYVDLKSLIDKLTECNQLMMSIDSKLQDYTSQGEKYLG
jgi:chromosome segregation ATPase